MEARKMFHANVKEMFEKIAKYGKSISPDFILFMGD
jgi:hypothetical protein